MTDRTLTPELEAIRARLPEYVAELERRAPYGALLATSSSGLQVAVSNREQRVSEGGRSLGAVLSAWNGAFLQERAVGSLDPGALMAAARTLGAELELQPGRAPEPGTPRDEHLTMPMEIDPRAQTPSDKLDLCRRCHAAVRGLDPRIVNAMISYSETSEDKVFANRTRLLSQSITRIRFNVMLIVADGHTMQRDWLAKDGSGGLEIARVSDEELRALAAEAVALLGAGHIEPGFYDVVFDPTVSGVMAHEAFGHGVEVDMFVKGRARSAEYLGKRVGSPLVNLLDDPTVPGAYGSYMIDDEGEIATPTTILREGVFMQGLTDLYSAFKLGMPRTANGRRQGYDRKAYARMSNTFFAPGATPVDALIAGLERGVYLRKISSGMEDPKGWGVQVETNIGEEIVDGRRTGRLFSPVGITGYVPDILTSVSAVGNDFSLDGGTCGKGWKENVPVSSGGPHLRLKARLG